MSLKRADCRDWYLISNSQQFEKMSIFCFQTKYWHLKLAKIAFIGQETVRKQRRHNFSWSMYTLIAVFVHFNHFRDLKINFHTNPYNLASSRLLWFWAPCGGSSWLKFCLIRKHWDSRNDSFLRDKLSVPQKSW